MMNINEMMSQMQAFRTNPLRFMAQKKLNIPQNLQNNPQAIIQHLLNNGTMTQQQFNELQNTAKQMQSNPQFAQFFK